jgi:peptidylprolyl isomerase
MKYTILTLLIAASAAAAIAQTSITPVATPATNAKPASAAVPAAKPATAAAVPVASADIPAKPADVRCDKLGSCVLNPPPGVPPAKGALKTVFTLRYQDIKIGTGAVAEPSKEYIFHYTAWLASNGQKFDTSYEHRGKIMDKDRKPVKDANGKDELGPPQPFSFVQGTQGNDRMLLGLDQGFAGMRVGGKRRIIVPYQMAYGTGVRPAPDTDHSVGIPPKSDLIFDVELLAVNDPPPPAKRGSGPPPPGAPRPNAPASQVQLAHPGASANPPVLSTPKAVPAPAAAPAPAAPQPK